MTMFTRDDLLRRAGSDRLERGATLTDTIADLYEDEWSVVGTVHDGDAKYMAMIHWDGLGSECECPDGRGASGVFCEHAAALGLCYLGEDEPDLYAGFSGYVNKLASLWGASTADELRKALVLHPTLRSSADAFEPEALFAKHHRDQPEDAIVTALLLLTDTRWRDATSRLVRRIEATNIIDDEGLDLLAYAFLQADRFLYWRMPVEWFEGPAGSIDIELEPNAASHRSVVEDQHDVEGDLDEDDVDEPVVAPRAVSPPLRRWAAARLVTRDPQRWTGIWHDAEAGESRVTAAIKCGVLDAIESIPATAHDALIDSAVECAHHSVRQIGYTLVADRRGAGVAHELAKHDRNAKIRTWSATLLRPAVERATPTQDPSPRETPPQARRPDAGEQPSLF
jgi:hypothetical protein